jgi:8-amino-7-oxononanoate synthase
VKQAPPALAHLAYELRVLAQEGLLRERPAPLSPEAVSFCSNDYLGLASRTCTGLAGAGASRLVAGERAEHAELERECAAWLGADAALAFSSGYAANLGTLAALAREGDLLVSDERNHASLVDGARLSRARIAVVPHVDANAVEQALAQSRGGRAWVITESYFSMDADSPDLAALRGLCDQRGAALVVDEAHALGVFGPEGRGLCAAAGVVPDVLIGTFGKAFGASGAFVAGCKELIGWLWNRARTFVYSTGMSPACATAALDGLRVARRSPHLRGSVLANAKRLRHGLHGIGVSPLGHGHIIPWVLGRAESASEMSSKLAARGVHALAIRPPSVPTGTARLRLTVSAHHTERDVDRATAAVRECLE